MSVKCGHDGDSERSRNSQYQSAEDGRDEPYYGIPSEDEYEQEKKVHCHRQKY